MNAIVTASVNAFDLVYGRLVERSEHAGRKLALAMLREVLEYDLDEPAAERIEAFGMLGLCADLLEMMEHRTGDLSTFAERLTYVRLNREKSPVHRAAWALVCGSPWERNVSQIIADEAERRGGADFARHVAATR